MENRSKRFVKLGVIGTALEDPVERETLAEFILTSVLTPARIREQLIVELENLKFIGPGDTFTSLSARNKVTLDGLSAFLKEKFGSEWNPKD